MYFTTSDYNKFISEIIDTKIKELVNKSNISRFINDSDLNKKMGNISNKSKIKCRTRWNSKTGNIWFKLFSWQKFCWWWWF